MRRLRHFADDDFGAPSQTRTGDPLIKRPVFSIPHDAEWNSVTRLPEIF